MTNVNDSIWRGFKRYSIPNTQFTLTGVSEAARHTCLYIPEIDMLLDCGMPYNFVPKRILITHCHWDHISGIGSSLFEDRAKPTVILPRVVIQKFGILLDTMLSLGGGNAKHTDRVELLPATIGERITMTINNKPWIIEPIKCIHSVPTTGYGLIEVDEPSIDETDVRELTQSYGLMEIRNDLKTEFKGLASSDIASIVRSGVKVAEPVEHPIICYLCDTDHRVLTDPLIDKYNVIIIECTFLSVEDARKAKKDKHMHWDNLEPYIMAHPTKTFFLIHFSQRYDVHYIRSFFVKKGYTNVIPFGV